jgi:HlyD family secretion protein
MRPPLLFTGRRGAVILSLCLFGLLALYLASYHFFFRSGSGEALYAARGQVGQRTSVGALGRIEPWSEVINLGAGSAPDRLEALLVARGEKVKKDQVLGYLGGHAEQVALSEVYRAELEEASSRRKTQTPLDELRIAAAEVHERQVLEVSPQRIAAQEATIAGLEAKLANEKDIMEAQQLLLSRGTSTRRQNEDQKSTVLQVEANLRSARARLEELRRQFEIDQKDARVQVELAQATRHRQQVDFPIASLQQQIALAEVRAKRLTISAPVDGRILNVRVKPGEEIGSGPILTLGDTSRMRAVAEVYETEIGQIRLGQAATVTSRALSKPINGTVVRIGDMIFKNDILNVDPATRADARVVQVWIELKDPAAVEGLTNLTVDVLIETSGAGSVAGTVGQAPIKDSSSTEREPIN